MEIILKNRCCLYVIISIRFFSITICNLLIKFPSYFKNCHQCSLVHADFRHDHNHRRRRRICSARGFVIYRSFAKTESRLKICIFQEKLLNVLKCYNFIWVQRRHNCSPAASFANCVLTLYLFKVHLQTFLSMPNNSKMPNFVLWHFCRKWAMCNIKCLESTTVIERAYRILVAIFNTLRTGLLNCLNARSRGLNFRHRASCI